MCHRTAGRLGTCISVEYLVLDICVSGHLASAGECGKSSNGVFMCMKTGTYALTIILSIKKGVSGQLASAGDAVKS